MSIVITSETEAAEAIAAISAWLDTKPDIDAEEVLRNWAHELIDDRVDDMMGCPLCQG